MALLPATPTSNHSNNIYEDLLIRFKLKGTPGSATKALRTAATVDFSVNTLTPPATPAPAMPTIPRKLSTDSKVEGLENGSSKPSDDETPRHAQRLRSAHKGPAFTATTRRGSHRHNRASTKTDSLLLSDMLNSPTAGKSKQEDKNDTVTLRQQVPSDKQLTLQKRNFYVHCHRDYFLPLLPPKNYIAKLGVVYGHTEPAVVPKDILTDQPEGITGTLKPHQLTGLSYLAQMFDNGMSCILGDEMGLGKTLQALSLFQLLETRQTSRSVQNRPYLVVCPMGVIDTWVAQAKKWTPGLKALGFHGDKDTRTKQKESIHQAGIEGDDYKIVVTSYETAVQERDWLKSRFVWRSIVVDEAHHVKNPETKKYKAIHCFSTEHRLLMTGTPIQNDLQEMWAFLHLLMPDVFVTNTRAIFTSAFNLAQGISEDQVLANAGKLLKLIMLRRTKNDPSVELDLPPKVEVIISVPLTSEQLVWYQQLLRYCYSVPGIDPALADTADDARALEAADQSAEIEELNENQQLRNLVQKLRSCCTHPHLLLDPDEEPPYVGDDFKNVSSKFIVLDKIVDSLVLQSNKKIIIFSCFTTTLDMTETLLSVLSDRGKKFRWVRIDGQTGIARRRLNMDMFNDMSSPYKVILVSIRAGGHGINLLGASAVVFLDQDWNPQVTLQAEDRAHRIGQTKPVTVYKLHTQGTVEEQIMTLIRKKLYLAIKLTGANRNDGRDAPTASDGNGLDSSVSELKALIRHEARTLTRPTINVKDMLTWDLATIVDKFRDNPSNPPAEDDAPIDEQAWLATAARVNAAKFGGSMMKRKKPNKDWSGDLLNLERADRRVGKNTTVMVDGYEVCKESMACKEHEAVPTLAGKDPSLRSRSRKREKIKHQDHCQACWKKSGEMQPCSLCPRRYHVGCLNAKQQMSGKACSQFHCPQDTCASCSKTTSNAGGLLCRCRFCPQSFCYQCLTGGRYELIGDELPELQLLGHGMKSTTFFVKCQACVDRHSADPQVKLYFDEQIKEFERQWNDADQPTQAEEMVAVGEDGADKASMSTNARHDDNSSRASSATSNVELTDAATLESVSSTTPSTPEDMKTFTKPSGKRRAPQNAKENMPRNQGPPLQGPPMKKKKSMKAGRASVFA